MTEKESYEVKLVHEDSRREIENYINQAKALGFNVEGYGNLQGYVSLISVVAQIETNNQRKWGYND